MTGRFARPYAQALLKVAGSTEAAVAVRDELRRFRQAMDEVPGIAKMAANPAVPNEAKGRVVGEIAERLELGALARRFVELLLSNYRLQHLPAVVAALEQAINRRLGVATARVRTAQPVEDAEAERLRAALAERLGQTVELELEVDPELIAGFQARVGSTLFDASLRGQLDRMARTLAEA